MPSKYPQELKDRAVRMVLDHLDDYDSRFAAVCAVAAKCDIKPESLRRWVVQAQVDCRVVPGVTTEDKTRIAQLEKENRELRRANEILKAASAFFARELDPKL